MSRKIDMSYILKFRESFMKTPSGKSIEMEIDRLGADNGKWEIPPEFKEFFKNYSIRIEPVE